MENRPHFRLFGIPVRVEILFWIVTAVIGYSLGSADLVIMWVGVVFVSVLIHELGHAIALKIFGQRSSIVLHGFGGLTFSQRRLSKWQSILVSLAGPLTALVLLGLPLRALQNSDAGLDIHRSYEGGLGLWPLIVLAAYVNVWWSLLNLVPIRPLDGGNVMTELVGVKTARVVSIVFGAGAAVYIFVYEQTFQFAGFYAAMLAFVNFREWQQARQGTPAPSIFDIEAPDATSPGSRRSPKRSRPGRGTSPLRSVPTYTQPSMPASPPVAGGLDVESATSLGWNAVRSGDATLARRTVARSATPVTPFLTGTISVLADEGIQSLVAAYRAQPDGPSNLVPATVVAQRGLALPFGQALLSNGTDGITAAASVQTHLHYAEQFEHAAAVGQLIYAAGSPARAQVAFDTACSWSRAGHADKALQWLGRAIDDGFRAPGLIDGEPDLAATRAHPGWASVRAKLD